MGSSYSKTEGINVRTYLAAKAMQGYLAMFSGGEVPVPEVWQVADYAVRCADALLEELNK